MNAVTNDKMMNSEHYDVAVVGAGPAGIMAAIFAAKTGAQVALFEKNEKIGRKILATGNGRCNLTNRNITLNRYHGNDVSFVAPILANFDQLETMKFFESIGVLLKEEDAGRIFPRTNQASSVVDALETQLASKSVRIFTGFTIKSIISLVSSSSVAPVPEPYTDRPGKDHEILRSTQNDNLWEISAETGDAIIAEKLILATGGKAAYQFGSSGDGLFWARNLGHEIVPIHAALVPIVIAEENVKEIMGIRLVSNAKLLTDGKFVAGKNGDILFTHFGISGPAAMGLARDADILLSKGKKVEISLDIIPDYDTDKLDEVIANLANTDGKKNIKNVLSGLISKNLVSFVLSESAVDGEIKAAELSKKQRQEIVGTLKDFRFTIKGVRPLKEAQVMAGGVSTDELTSLLESKIIPGLYFAGEILDIDGDSGGFNLQWAWSSGKVAGEAAARSISGIN